MYSVFHTTMADLTYVEVEHAARQGASVLLPVGVIEEHGPHLPLGVDTYVAVEFVRQVRDELMRRGVPAVIAPPFYWGINSITNGFAGSFSTRPATMKAVLLDVLVSLYRWGFAQVFALNFHGDDRHFATLVKAVREARLRHGVPVRVVLSGGEARNLGFYGDEPFLVVHNPVTADQESELPDPSATVDLHAGATETGFMARYYPGLVNLHMTRALTPSQVTHDDVPTWERGGAGARRLAPQGYVGDPAAYDVSKLKQLVDWLVRCMADAIADAVAASGTQTHSPADAGG